MELPSVAAQLLGTHTLWARTLSLETVWLWNKCIQESCPVRPPPKKTAALRRQNLNANQHDESRSHRAAGASNAWDRFRQRCFCEGLHEI